MPQVKVQHVISFTSEDPKCKVEDMLNGKGIWLCNANEQSGSIKVDFQILRATTIDYIDIGNYNSAMISIDVGMSSWPASQDLVSLLPTVALMTPPQCRLGQNSKGVRMFKKENMDKINVTKKWDRIRITCFQPFKKNVQFGLSFLKIYTQEELSTESSESDLSLVTDNYKMLSSRLPKVPSEHMSQSLKALEHSRIKAGREDYDEESPSPNISTPVSRAAKLVMAHKHVPNDMEGKQQKKDLECEALKFLISMNLTSEDIHSLKVSHIREEFEVRKNRNLSTREKLIFKNIALDYAHERLNKLEREEKESVETLIISDEDNEIEPLNKLTPVKASHKSKTSSLSSSSSRNNISLMDCAVTPSPNKMKRKKQTVGSVSNNSDCKVNKYIKRTNTIELSDSDESVITSDTECSFSLLEDPENSLGLKPIDKFGTLRRLTDNSIKEQIKTTECPLCAKLFPHDEIEGHCSSCEGNIHYLCNETGSSSFKDLREECPICNTLIKSEELQDHATECAENHFT